MVIVAFNARQQELESPEQFSDALDAFDRVEEFELWLSTPQGQSMCMLRNGSNVFLMYLRHGDRDAGLASKGEPGRIGVASYRLGNGQVDQYPLSWCIEVEQCYKALAYFFVNDGDCPDWIRWQEA